MLGAIALTLGACGGGQSDEDKVADVVEEASTSGDPAACTELATQRFVEQTQFSKGQQAVKSCEARAGRNPADSVDVSNVAVTDDRATAEASVEGGTFDGQTIEVALVKDGDQWKLDRVNSFVEFDREAFLAAAQARLTSPPNPLSATQARCVVKRFDHGTDKQLEDLILSGDQQRLLQVVFPCL